MSAALAAKDYALCEELNVEIEKLKQLIETLPTAADIMKAIKKEEASLQEALDSKKYALCEEIEKRIVLLRKDYTKAAASEAAVVKPEVRAIKAKVSVSSRADDVKAVVNAVRAGSLVSQPAIIKTAQSSTRASNKSDRPVSKLRPKPPILIVDTASVADVCRTMSSSRADAALVVSSSGELRGIITDNDVTRRVVSVGLDPVSTVVSEVMTSNPKCVSMDDSALDALEMMVDNRFRHLPVLSAEGSVVGLLDIAKCLYDTISVLERVHEGGEEKSISSAVLDAMKTSGRGGSQVAALKALLDSMFDGSMPTLRSILGHESFVAVAKDTVVREASREMARVRKGVLVLDGGALVGILTPNDILSRVVAKGLDADVTLVEEVMTANPDSVSDDLTLLDALREMHDHKYLHLPVCDSGGRVHGLVDVMELLCSTSGGSGGKGWRDFFASTGDIDMVETNSTVSDNRNFQPKQRSSLVKTDAAKRSNDRPVSKLRPKPPILVVDTSSVADVCRTMSSSRADAALVVSSSGELRGIITDNDVTRRVVSVGLDPVSTVVSEVMTSNPKCVSMDDSALDALEMMVDNRFRHLPVLSAEGSVVGLLDIAKCLYDTISVLERVHEGGEEKSMSSAVLDAMKKTSGRGGSQVAALKALLDSMFDGSMPTLRSILGHESFVAVSKDTVVREASREMARVRKGVLVLDGGALVGILTPKDILSRVVAKGLDADVTLVEEVMTANPDSVSDDLTLLDALREMHDHKYLHLPVCDSGGRVQGLVDVMELLCSTSGGSGGKGWRDFFASAAENQSVRFSDSLSVGSDAGASKRTQPLSKRTSRTVSRLKPKRPVLIGEDFLVVEACKMMSRHRADAAIVIDRKVKTKGIVTDKDIAKRVVAAFLDPNVVYVKDIMTKSPKCVSLEDSALDALDLMVKNRFRHLPVIGNDGSPVGILDIASCVYHTISALESMNEEGIESNIPEAVAEAMKRAGGLGKQQAAAMQLLFNAIFDGSMPTLSALVRRESITFVRPSTNVRETASLMAKCRKAVLIIEDDDLLGIFTPKDLLNRIVAVNKSPDLTAISSVMTPAPECISDDATILDAMKLMHDRKFFNLPVKNGDAVIGLVDVLELITYSSGENGSKGWRDFFASAGDKEFSEEASSIGDAASAFRAKVTSPRNLTRRVSSRSEQEVSDVGVSAWSDLVRVRSSASVTGAEFIVKVTDHHGDIHRLKYQSESLDSLRASISEKAHIDQEELLLKYLDEDKDEVILNSDETLKDAIQFAKSNGHSSLKISASVVPRSSKSKSVLQDPTTGLAIGAIGLSALALGIGAMMFLRKK